MWTNETSGESSADAARLFALLADTAGWPSWNPGVRRVELAGPFAVGTEAVMEFPDGSSLPFSITAVEQDRVYEDVTEVPDAGVSVRVRHVLEPTGTGTRITYRCEVTGADDATCAAVGSAVSGDFGEVIANLAKEAEKQAAPAS